MREGYKSYRSVKTLSRQRKVLTSGRQQDLDAVISSRDGKRGETDARKGKPGRSAKFARMIGGQ